MTKIDSNVNIDPVVIELILNEGALKSSVRPISLKFNLFDQTFFFFFYSKEKDQSTFSVRPILTFSQCNDVFRNSLAHRHFGES